MTRVRFSFYTWAYKHHKLCTINDNVWTVGSIQQWNSDYYKLVLSGSATFSIYIITVFQMTKLYYLKTRNFMEITLYKFIICGDDWIVIVIKPE